MARVAGCHNTPPSLQGAQYRSGKSQCFRRSGRGDRGGPVTIEAAKPGCDGRQTIVRRMSQKGAQPKAADLNLPLPLSADTAPPCDRVRGSATEPRAVAEPSAPV